MATSDAQFTDVSLHLREQNTDAVNQQPTTSTAEPQQQEIRENALNDATGNSDGGHNEAMPYGVFEYYKGKAEQFYCNEDGILDRAINDIKSQVYDKTVDGDIINSWLLLEVDHWDNETEKVVVLTEESLLTVRYDFVPKRVHKYKRVLLKEFDTMQRGDFLYPKHSLLNYTNDLKKRTCGGVRLLWNKGVQPGIIQNWKPSSDSMPWQTFTFHPLAFMDGKHEKSLFNVNHFWDAAVEAVKQAYAKHNPSQAVIVKEEAILQKIYLGLPSQVHNQSFLGMSKDRGFISF